MSKIPQEQVPGVSHRRVRFTFESAHWDSVATGPLCAD
jgi:hypothetical protein